ncbi:amino acid/amide ABC transporter substrate-binding protein (HAAT family) [Methylovirgula ligni]|uniref:Amino acid/amide ABC transporter substrate-binding protein (HAAT family) n=2 Tax=Methylovirgula ligni TaxID=569860 RepID=A0A3D9Z7U0_9HYPH|nr:amino acid/amide ABC transporter substrate-binding protein (HAAT family) [Methylovirgula ligni]
MEHAELKAAFRRALRICSRSMLMPAAGLVLFIGGVVPDVAQPAPATPAAQAPSLNVDILYLGRQYNEPPPLSLLDKIVTDEGIQGARIALQEDALTGRFVNQTYHLSEMILPLEDDFKAKARAALATHKLVIADLEKDDLLALADMPEAKNAIIFDIRTSDDSLRQEDCRANVFHFLPSRAMRTDALAQYLVWKRWTNWLLVSGKHPDDLAYAEAVKRSARKFGAKIVDERFYTYAAGSRRTDTGHQQVQQQLPLVTQNAPPYDVVFVADESEVFGEYMPYRTWDPRPVVGTAGLIAVAWHRSFEEYGGTQLQNRFEREVGRIMTERDYSAWLGIRAFGEAVLRSNMVQPAALRAYLLSDRFGVAGYKDESLNFRPWDLQLRQPVILASARDLVSVSPQEGFLNPNYLTDTLGFDKPESKCHLQ